MKPMKILRLSSSVVAVAFSLSIWLSSMQSSAVEVKKGWCWVTTPTGGYEGCTAGASLPCKYTNGCPATYTGGDDVT